KRGGPRARGETMPDEGGGTRGRGPDSAEGRALSARREGPAGPTSACLQTSLRGGLVKRFQRRYNPKSLAYRVRASRISASVNACPAVVLTFVSTCSTVL